MDRRMENFWKNVWNTPEYKKEKEENFNVIYNFVKDKGKNLDKEPFNILDIGCGLAIESEMFQKANPNVFLYLLDGDYKQNDKDIKKKGMRDVHYGSTDNFLFYCDSDNLIKDYTERNMMFSFLYLDRSGQVILPANVKVDLVYSFLSAGFHYPAVAYKDVCNKLGTDDTLYIFDIRKRTLEEQSKDFEVLDILRETKKFTTVSLKFKN